MPRWAMVIDLRKCIGCETCKHVCKDLHGSPTGGIRRRILIPEPAAAAGSQRTFFPIHCMHCEDPSCLEACPTGATRQLPDGIVVVDATKCMGCGACVLACPYGARTLESHECTLAMTKTDQGSAGLRRAAKIGTCIKCDFCRSDGEGSGLKETQTVPAPQVDPLCVKYCIAEALYFGDLEDPDSEVSQLLRQHHTIRLREDLGTKPSVYYISDEESD